MSRVQAAICGAWRPSNGPRHVGPRVRLLCQHPFAGSSSPTFPHHPPPLVPSRASVCGAGVILSRYRSSTHVSPRSRIAGSDEEPEIIRSVRRRPSLRSDRLTRSLSPHLGLEAVSYLVYAVWRHSLIDHQIHRASRSSHRHPPSPHPLLTHAPARALLSRRAPWPPEGAAQQMHTCALRHAGPRVPCGRRHALTCLGGGGRCCWA